MLKMVRHSWQMYFVGFLFGLGFDTASEVGILALSATSGQKGVPFWVIMLLPLLFMVGMCLIDALDGILMLGAYGWAFIKPIRKAYYNLSITVLSVLVAFVVGTYELMQILEAQFSLKGKTLEHPGPPALRQPGLRHHRHVPGGLAGLGAVLQVQELRIDLAKLAGTSLY